MDDDPQLFLFKDDHRYLWLFNERPMNEMLKDRSPMRTSDWNGKTIKMKPFNGDMDEYVENVRKFHYALESVATREVCIESKCYGWGACDWRQLPIAIAEMGRQERLHPKVGGTIYSSLIFGAEYFARKGCGSTKEFLNRIAQ